MGMDAYAVDHAGHRLKTRDRQGSFSQELVMAAQQMQFSSAARVIGRACDGVDAYFEAGGLGISANASAVNYLLFNYGQRPECDDAYTPEQVQAADFKIMSDQAPDIPIPSYVADDRSAMLHAKAFIHCCAMLGLGIRISP